MPSTIQERETIWRLRNLHDLSPKTISELFPNIPYPSIRRIAATWKPEQTVDTPPIREEEPEPKSKLKIVKDQAQGEIKLDILASQDRVQSLEDLINLANIDLNRWNIDRHIVNTWESAMKSKDNLPIITTLWQVKAFMTPKAKPISDLALESLREEIREGATQYKNIGPAAAKQRYSECMLEVSIPDFHFGKLSLEEETGEEWNLDIAEAVYRGTVKSLLESATSDGRPINRILLPLGNDLFNVDNAYLKTYLGTSQDNVHSVKQLFRHVKNIVRDSILDMRAIAPVDVIIVPGNHDKTISYFLGEAIEDWFWNDSAVTVDNSPKSRKYVHWGINLIGFTHGDKIKHDMLPGRMTDEEPHKWADSQWREWHIGHKHRGEIKVFYPLSTKNGVIIRTLPSLTSADNWHYDHGYLGGVRRAEAYLWDKEVALAGIYNCNLLN